MSQSLKGRLGGERYKQTDIVDHQVHDGFGHQVSDALVDDAHVGVHQVADGLHLPLQLRVHGEVLCLPRVLAIHLTKERNEGETGKVLRRGR